MKTLGRTIAVLLLLVAAGCGKTPANDPYPASDAGKNILYTSFTERPKHLDPAQSYTSDEAEFTSQVYEPPLQYHYLKRPYELIPATALEVPKARLFDAQGRELPADAPVARVAYSEYVIRIRPGIRYQPHPAFAKSADGKVLYLDMPESQIRDKYEIADFPETGTRELLAEDYVYEIKRLAHPRFVSPILGHMSDYIVGLKELADSLQAENKKVIAEHEKRYGKADRGLPWLDLRKYDLSGVKAIDSHTIRYAIIGFVVTFLATFIVSWLARLLDIPFEISFSMILSIMREIADSLSR